MKSHFAGKVKVCSTDVPGSICQVAVQVPQVSPKERSGYEITHRYNASDYAWMRLFRLRIETTLQITHRYESSDYA